VIGDAELVLVRATRGIKSPLFVKRISTPADASGSKVSGPIPRFCAFEIFPINNEINMIKIIVNFFIIFFCFLQNYIFF